MTIEQDYYDRMYDRQCELRQAMSIIENEAEVRDLEYEIYLEEEEEENDYYKRVW